MKSLRFLVPVLCLTLAVQATTVVAPTFDELVRESELVFRGRVTAMRSGWSGTTGKPRIATWVTFSVERTLRGEAGTTITLEFIGGTIGDKRLEAVGWPQFAVGDRGVFFVENRQARLCPLAHLRHGRYRIVADDPTGAERVVRDDYSPVEAATNTAVPLSEHGGSARANLSRPAFTLAEFETLVTTRSAALPLAERTHR